MAVSYDPNAPLIDPDIQAALEQGRQAQLAALLSRQQQGSAPRNMGEGIDALGKGLMQGLANYMAGRNASANSAAMATALGGAQPMPFLGGASTMTPMTLPPAAAAAVGPQADATTSGDINVNQFMAGLKKAEGVPYGGFSSTGAIGAYGLTGGFIKDWGSKLGLPIDRASYINNPGLQDQLAAGAAQRMHDKYGNWGDVAQTWETGGPHTPASATNTRADKYRATVLGTASQADPGTAIPPQPSPDQISANIGPASHIVPAGLVAGPGVPSNLPPPGYRDNLGAGIGGSQGSTAAPAVPPAPPPQAADEEEEAPQNIQGMFSPTPIGAPQQLLPPGRAPITPGSAAVQPGVQPPVVAQVPPTATAGGLAPQNYAPGGAAPPGTHWAHLPGPPLLLAGDEGGGTAPQQSGGGGVIGNLLSQLFGGGQANAQPQIRTPAPMAAGLAGQPQTSGPMLVGAPGGPPVNHGQGGLAAGLGGQPQQAQPGQLAGGLSGNQAVYKQMYDAAAGPAARLQHAAALAAASGNTALAQEYEKQAAPYAAEMNKANELAVADRTKPPPQTPLTDEQAAAYGIKDKAGYTWNPTTGKPEQIAGTADKSDTASIKEFEYGQAHPEFSRAPKWVPNASINDLGQPVPGWVSPPNPAGQGKTSSPTSELTDDQKKLVGEPATYSMPNVAGGPQPAPTLQLTDEQHAALNSIPEARRSMVQSILQRDMVAPTISARNPLPAMLRQDVLKVMPNFDFASQPGQVKAKAEFLAGGPGSYSKQIEFGSTAVNHLATYADASDDLDKAAGYSEGKLASVIGGPSAQELGTKFAGRTTAGQAAINALNGTAMNFSGELTKYLTGAEGSQAEREQRASALSPDLTTNARKLAVLRQLDLIEGRGTQIQDAWHNIGPNIQDFPVISPTTQKSIDKIRNWATTGPGAVSLTGSAATAVAPTPASPVGGGMPPRNVAPQITGAPVSPTAPKIRVYNPSTGKIE